MDEKIRALSYKQECVPSSPSFQHPAKRSSRQNSIVAEQYVRVRGWASLTALETKETHPGHLHLNLQACVGKGT